MRPVDARSPIDDFRPPWPSFAAFFAERGPRDRYLAELDRDRGTRREWDAPGWRRRVGATVAWLASRGVGPGGCVASLAGNSADALALAYAAWVAGACYVPLNPHDSAERQAFILRDAGVGLLVATETHAERARAIAAGVDWVTAGALPTDGEPPPETGPGLDTPALRDGWFHSGDEGFWEPGADGRPWFFITGRMKELIIRGGVNISPFEIDEVLRSHPAVAHALAVPFDNRFYGDEIAAYVVAGSPVTETELLAHCARHLDFARQPKLIVFGDDVPYTPTGKAKRLELKERLAPQLAAHCDTQFRAAASTACPPART